MIYLFEQNSEIGDKIKLIVSSETKELALSHIERFIESNFSKNVDIFNAYQKDFENGYYTIEEVNDSNKGVIDFSVIY